MNDKDDFTSFDDHPLHALMIAELWGDTDARAKLELDLRGWIDALTSTIESVDVQFGVRRADYESKGGSAALAEYLEWKGRANGFKRRVVQKLRSVKALRKQGNANADHTHDRSRYFALLAIAEITDAATPTVIDLDVIRRIIDELRAAGAL